MEAVLQVIIVMQGIHLVSALVDILVQLVPQEYHPAIIAQPDISVHQVILVPLHKISVLQDFTVALHMVLLQCVLVVIFVLTVQVLSLLLFNALQVIGVQQEFPLTKKFAHQDFIVLLVLLRSPPVQEVTIVRHLLPHTTVMCVLQVIIVLLVHLVMLLFTVLLVSIVHKVVLRLQYVLQVIFVLQAQGH